VVISVNNFLIGLGYVFQPAALLMLFVGVASGIIVGALPGLTATMGVALLVPFSFGMEPVPAMLLLLGLYVGAIYGGSISAILIRTPGTPASAATLLDGYPLFMKGKAGLALGTATFSSVFGGIGSAIFLITISPILSKFALSFSAPEYFMLAFFGLTIIVSISGKSLTKGLIGGIFGLLLATFGFDSINGYPRFSFNFIELYEGIPFIPAMIGLFAFSEALNQFTKFTISKSNTKLRIKDLLLSKETIKKILPILLKSTVIGTFIGALPGAGGDIASFVCYNEAKKSSKHPELFGTGIIEGVAASETGNNSSTGGALIPTLSLGIPGDTVTAVIIGALIMHGLRPGPLLFRDNLEIVYALFVGFLCANIFMGILGLISIGFLGNLISMSKKMIIPIIMVFAIIGSYAIQNNLFDINIMIAMGVIGYILQKIDIPIGPIVLALILGPMAENQFRKALIMFRGDYSVFITRPISLILLILSVMSLVTVFIRQKKERENKSLKNE